MPYTSPVPKRKRRIKYLHRAWDRYKYGSFYWETEGHRLASHAVHMLINLDEHRHAHAPY